MVDFPATKTRMRLEEFKVLPESHQRIELIDGELIMSPTLKYSHQRLVFTIAKYINRVASQGETVVSPMDVYIGGEDSLQPDVFWVAPDSKCKLGDDDVWHGAPDLVVEILSPSTAKHDKIVKFDLYEKHGVREYWIVDPKNLFLEVYALEEGKFSRRGVFGLGETFPSGTLNVDVDVNALLGQP